MGKINEVHKGIEKYYDSNPRKELLRLNKGAKQRLEFFTTLVYLKKYLPKNGRILDVGSGPGKYSIELARMGYSVTLLDPAEKSLRLAELMFKRKGLKADGFVRGRAEDMSTFASSSFDAVVSLGGPLSHIMDEGLRNKAVSEIVRVAKKNATIFVSVMGRLTVLQFFVRRDYSEILAPYFKNWLRTGNYFGGYGFAPFHGFYQEELENLVESKGVRKLDTVGLEGFCAYPDVRKLNEMEHNKKIWDIWFKTHLSIASNPVLVGVSEHMLFVGKKK